MAKSVFESHLYRTSSPPSIFSIILFQVQPETYIYIIYIYFPQISTFADKVQGPLGRGFILIRPNRVKTKSNSMKLCDEH